MKKHIVKLTKKDRNILKSTVNKGVHKASVIRNRNSENIGINWSFTKKDAKSVFKELYS